MYANDIKIYFDDILTSNNFTPDISLKITF